MVEGDFVAAHVERLQLLHGLLLVGSRCGGIAFAFVVVEECLQVLGIERILGYRKLDDRLGFAREDLTIRVGVAGLLRHLDTKRLAVVNDNGVAGRAGAVAATDDGSGVGQFAHGALAGLWLWLGCGRNHRIVVLTTCCHYRCQGEDDEP